MLEGGGKLLEELAQESLFQNQQDGEVESPDEEVPARPCQMPVAAHTTRRLKNSRGLLTRLPPGDIEVLPEPGAEGDVPPPPELGDRLGDIGVVEVAHELEAQHPAQAHSHVGVAGEVEVELESESGHAQPCPSSGELPGGEGQNGIPQLADVVGQQDLFARPTTKICTPEANCSGSGCGGRSGRPDLCI